MTANLVLHKNSPRKNPLRYEKKKKKKKHYRYLEKVTFYLCVKREDFFSFFPNFLKEK